MIYKVKLLEKEYEVFEIKMSIENKLGELYESEGLIEINEDQSDSNKSIVLFHELVHALFQQTGHSEYDNDEDLIDCIALGIYSLVKNNDFDFMKKSGDKTQ